MKIIGKNKSRLLQARKQAAAVLFSLGFNQLGRAVFPAIQGASTWKSGNGYTIAFSGGTNAGVMGSVADPAEIDLGEAGIWTGDKITLNGVTPLLGSQDKIQVVKVTVPGDLAITLASTSGNVPGLLTVTNPAGSTVTASAWVVNVAGPNYRPNSTDGNQKVVSIKLAVANVILAGL